MSDASQKGSTAPMGAAPPARAATQVSAAVPALEGAPVGHGAPVALPAAPDEISGSLVVHGAPLGAPTPSQPPFSHPQETPGIPSHRAAAAATKMSAAVDPNAFNAVALDPRPEDAVTFAAPAPIVDRAAQARGGTFDTGHPGAYQGGSAYAGVGQGKRGMSGLVLGLLIGGALAVLLGIAALVVAFFVLRVREASAPPRALPATATAAASAPAPPPSAHHPR